MLKTAISTTPEVSPPIKSERHQRHGRVQLAADGKGVLRFSGPFRPTAVGTDRYVDELR